MDIIWLKIATLLTDHGWKMHLPFDHIECLIYWIFLAYIWRIEKKFWFGSIHMCSICFLAQFTVNARKFAFQNNYEIIDFWLFMLMAVYFSKKIKDP